MLFSRNSKIALVLAVLIFLASCAPTSGGRNNRDDNITLLEDAELQTTEEYAQLYEDEQNQEDAEEDIEQQFDEYGNLIEPEEQEQQFDEYGNLIEAEEQEQQFDEYGNLIEPEEPEQEPEQEQEQQFDEYGNLIEPSVDDTAPDESFVVQDNVAEVIEEPLAEGEIDSSDGQVAQVGESVIAGETVAQPQAPVEPVVVPKISLEERFGPNPYIANPPVVIEQAKIDFNEALALLRAEASLTGKDDSKKFESKAEEVEVKVPETDATTKMKLVVENYPELSGPAYNLAFYYYQLDYTGEALKYLDVATNRNFYNLQAHNLKGKIYRDKSDFEKAEKAYKDAISAWGGYLPAYKNIGIMYDLYMGQPEKAYEYYKQYNEYNPEEDRQVVGWQVVIERKMKAIQAKKDAEAAAILEQQQAEAQAAAEAAGETFSQSNIDQGQVPEDNGTAQPTQVDQGDVQDSPVVDAESSVVVEQSENIEAVEEESSVIDQALEAAEDRQVNEAGE